MSRAWFVGLLALSLAVAVAGASEKEKQVLIQLDKEWGNAGGAGDAAVLQRILADDVISVDGEGVGTRADLLADLESGEGPQGPYKADQYEVRFLNETTALMTHHVGEPDPHWSLHLWVKKEGRWQVVATMGTPVED